MAAEHEISFQPIGKRVTVPAGTTVFEAARLAGIELASACGGEGKCGLCRVVLIDGTVSGPTPVERAMIGFEPMAAGTRLACRTHILDQVRVQVPETSLVTGPRLQITGDVGAIELDPAVAGFQLELDPPTLEDPRSDLARVVDGLRRKHGVEVAVATPAVVRSLGAALRSTGWSVTAFVGSDRLVGVSPAGTDPLGLAVDLGTTKIAAHLVDLVSGQDLTSGGVANPQISYGEDVISRLNYAVSTPDGGRLLADLVKGSIDQLLGELVEQAGVDRSQVVDACLVGNTAMIHLLLEYPVQHLVRAPFVGATCTSADVAADELRLTMAPGARVHIPGCIGGFVGADHVAMILASGVDRHDRVVLGVDIGTNTEIVLHKPADMSLTATSCASGPAFEGAHIVDGMRAAAGAIERLAITPTGLDIAVIGDVPAVGLCGSGIVDSVAELFRKGLIDGRGRFRKEAPPITLGEHGPQLVLVPAPDSASGRDVVITQHDVNEIQLAKGAIHAGVDVLLEVTGTTPDEVDEVIIAGAFGSFLDIGSALDIGLFPQLPRAGYRQVGNAAVVGAIRMVLSRRQRRRADEILAAVQYQELTIQPSFSRRFALGMLFPNGHRVGGLQVASPEAAFDPDTANETRQGGRT